MAKNNGFLDSVPEKQQKPSAVSAGLQNDQIGLPVPPGFIITTAACKVYQQKAITAGYWQEVLKELKN